MALLIRGDCTNPLSEAIGMFSGRECITITRNICTFTAKIFNMKTLFTLLLMLFLTNINGQYTLSSYYSFEQRTLGVELVKTKKSINVGAGISTFFLRGAKGTDYTGFYNPSQAYEMVTNYNGSLYGVIGKTWKNVFVNTRIGMGARKHYYNGDTNGVLWYVVRDGGTYLLYGGQLGITVDNVRLSVVYDNVNHLSLGIGIIFKEHTKTKHNENHHTHTNRIPKIQNSSKQNLSLF